MEVIWEPHSSIQVIIWGARNCQVTLDILPYACELCMIIIEIFYDIKIWYGNLVLLKYILYDGTIFMYNTEILFTYSIFTIHKYVLIYYSLLTYTYRILLFIYTYRILLFTYTILYYSHEFTIHHLRICTV